MALLYASVSLFALLVKRLATHSGDAAGWITFGATLLNQDIREEWETMAIAVGLVVAFAAPGLGRRSFRAVEQGFSRFAAHPKQAILAAALFPVVVRLALLQVIPIPQPQTADEFGYLLQADTFASGRVTNPTHPMWPHFESLYVLHEPTYTSIYPIAQSLLLAVPVALGAHPWFGVSIGMGCMCAALCWMLQQWLPLKWALLGAMLAGARFSIAGYWMNSYWGGAAAAIGGALLLGALPRILRQGRTRDAFVAGLGAAILSQSRPFEGLLLCLPVGALLLYRLVGGPRERLRLLVPLTGVSVMIVAGALYYNWRVTGNALLLPYRLHQRIYGTPQNLRWSAPVLEAPRAKQQKDIWDNFEWQLGIFQWQSSWLGLGIALSAKLKTFWSFYLQPILSLPLLFLPLVVRRGSMRFLSFTGLFVLFAGCVLYPFFFAHYAAPLCGLLLVLLLQGARYLRVIRWRRIRAGAALFRWCVATGMASSFLLLLGGMLDPESVALGVTPRSRIEEDLKQRGGKHLVLVRYQQSHRFHDEWIYNSADIDKSRVIWARELDEASTSQLLRRYPDRAAWLAEPEREGSSVIAYADKDNPQVSAILNTAGKSPYFRTGVSPGSIVTLFGWNLVHSSEDRAENCALSGARGDGRSHPETMLTGLDGSRPGVVVKGLTEGLPSLAMAETREGSGAVLSMVGEHGERTGPHGVKQESVGVQFGDLPAPVLCLANSGGAESVTVQVPFGLLGESVDVVVRSGDRQSILKGVPVLPANPGIFEYAHHGKKAAVLLHPDGTLVSPENGARHGETLRMFATGIGAVDANGPRFPLIVGVNHGGAPLQSVNCAECRSGIAELRFEVPQGTPSGEEIPLSLGVVVNGKTVYSNNSIFAIR